MLFGECTNVVCLGPTSFGVPAGSPFLRVDKALLALEGHADTSRGSDVRHSAALKQHEILEGKGRDIIHLFTTSVASAFPHNALQVQTGASLSGRSRLANATDCSTLPEVRWHSLTLLALPHHLLSALAHLLRHPKLVELVSGSILCVSAHLQPPVMQMGLFQPHCVVPKGSIDQWRGHLQAPMESVPASTAASGSKAACSPTLCCRGCHQTMCQHTQGQMTGGVAVAHLTTTTLNQQRLTQLRRQGPHSRHLLPLCRRLRVPRSSQNPHRRGGPATQLCSA